MHTTCCDQKKKVIIIVLDFNSYKHKTYISPIML